MILHSQLYWFSLLSIGCIGAVIGSFINMLSYRLPKGLPIVFKRSFCSLCNQSLGAKQLIPIFSFLFQKGCCCFCKKRIPIRYLICELLSISIFVSCYIVFGPSLMFIKNTLFLSGLLVLFFSDLETGLLPDSVTLGFIPIGLLFAYVSQSLATHSLALGIGLALFGGIYFIGYLIYGKEALGIGDIKLAACMGSFLGIKGVVVASYLSFIIGGLMGLYYLFILKKKRSDAMPFGPAMIIGAAISLFFADELYTWYMNWAQFL